VHTTQEEVGTSGSKKCESCFRERLQEEENRKTAEEKGGKKLCQKK
jgi:hypothetical protein